VHSLTKAPAHDHGRGLRHTADMGEVVAGPGHYQHEADPGPHTTDEIAAGVDLTIEMIGAHLGLSTESVVGLCRIEKGEYGQNRRVESGTKQKEKITSRQNLCTK